MILGLGNDICNSARIERIFARHGARFTNRILTAAELAQFNKRTSKIAYLTNRFAAKEAIYKAIASYMAPPPSWHDAEILNDAQGKPIVALSKRCDQALECAANGPVHVLLSLSDDAPYAFAVCIVETKSQ